jgi:hypothetical protein
MLDSNRERKEPHKFDVLSEPSRRAPASIELRSNPGIEEPDPNGGREPVEEPDYPGDPGPAEDPEEQPVED